MLKLVTAVNISHWSYYYFDKKSFFEVRAHEVEVVMVVGSITDYAE